MEEIGSQSAWQLPKPEGSWLNFSGQRGDDSRRLRRRSMRKDTKVPDHPLLAEEKYVKETFVPGKGGGAYNLPLGGLLLVPEGLCSKKESVVCRVVPPSQRWRYHPDFPGEHLTSEIFILSGNVHFKNKHLVLLLPYYPPEGKQTELNVKGMWKDEFTWVDVGFIVKEPAEDGSTNVELQLNRLGTFAVTFRPKTDPFQMTPNGGLFHSHLNRYLTVRFPKKALETTIGYNLRIEPIPEERLAFCREYFAHDCCDLVAASEFIDLAPDTRCNFRRNSTIKLPLPDGVEVEGEQTDDIVVLHRELGEWQWLDCKYKFTRSNISFDVRNPTRFLVVKTKPDRGKKMQVAAQHLDESVGKEKGQVNIFLSLKDKSWHVLVEVFPLSVATAKITQRQEQGFTVVHRVPMSQEVTTVSSFSRRPPPPRDFKPRQLDGFELFDGLTWILELEDDLQLGADTDLRENDQLVCYRHVKESYRRFPIVPATEEERTLRGTVILKPVGIDDSKRKDQLTISFWLDITDRMVAAYHYLPPEPQPEPVKSATKFEVPVPEYKPVAKTPSKVRTFSASALERLTQPTRRASIPDKEAKVLSGRSMMTLSKVVNEGLTLAVHLELPDSTITGIGFDAMSNNRSMSEVGYRILLYWKRTRKDKRDGAVQELVRGIRAMGKNGIADVVEERHRENKELTMDCFVMAAVSGVNIHC
ncbi:hypothetical protein ACOMHN_052882 [Nucella lapillus]